MWVDAFRGADAELGCIEFERKDVMGPKD